MGILDLLLAMMQFSMLYCIGPGPQTTAMCHDAPFEQRSNPLASFLFTLLFCVFFQDDEKFLTELFAQLTDEATDDDKRQELVMIRASLMYIVTFACCTLACCWPATFFCLLGQFSEGVLRLLTDSTATKQRCVLQDPLQHGNSACVGSYIGESESVPSEA